ncbi:acyl-CoA synthetase [Pseudonocardia xinjiangensis]|uniref:Acyl-CoA synthetase n=1 Tax=Pseudonocardia xinjiangensis TaxID=75289 RepID=A0ABX1RDI5_9PSEU|nr:acyl-CoA synthetase [Pseudonocardia xinjiangensis]NMH77714.1 acyl-CoA synthetase [Pseudonocardia xinjiangensis]
MFPGTFAALTPDKPAVVMSDTGAVMTYAELDERSVRLAHVLHHAGLRPGDVVALLAENIAEFWVVYWAALRSGLYFTPINRHLSVPEITYIVTDCGAKALVVSAAMAEATPGLPGRTPGVALHLAMGGPQDGYDDYEAALTAASPEPSADQPRGATLLYSSGTTGQPKGIRPPLPGEQIDANVRPAARVLREAHGYDADTVYLCPAPLYHAAPLAFCGTVHATGGAVVVMPRFDAETALEAIERHRVTHSLWVPTMFVRMLKLPDDRRSAHDLSSHRLALHGAAPCPVEVKRKMIEWWGPILHEYFASSEGLGMTLIDSAEWLRKPGSVGRPAFGILHVCDDAGKELPTGEVGLVYVERDVFPFTYHNDPGKTRRSQHPEHANWGTTGDIGYLDEDGYLFLTDRKAFVIISGGVNIYPQEVENALALHPAVLDVAVFGIPDADMGEQVKAVVQPAAGVPAGPELAGELIAYLRERIAHYKVPRSVDFAAALPRSEAGKLQKGKLRAGYPPSH